MKELITFLLLYICIFSTNADCGSSGLQVFPSGEVLYPNSLIMIQSDWSYEKVMRGLGDEIPVYLGNEKHTIHLLVNEVCDTETGYFQVFLEPKSKLPVGEKFQLYIENHNIEWIDMRSIYGFPQNFEWRVSDREKLNPPSFSSKPRFVECVFNAYGCGCEQNAVFQFKTTNKSDILFLAEVVNVETNETQMAYIPPKENKIFVGRGMCGGPFGFEFHKKYKVRFRIRDSAGNFSKDWSNWIEFKSPSPSMISSIF